MRSRQYILSHVGVVSWLGLIDQSEGEGHTDPHVFALGVAFELAHGIDRDGVEHPIRGRLDVDVLRLMLEAALTKDSFYICV